MAKAIYAGNAKKKRDEENSSKNDGVAKARFVSGDVRVADDGYEKKSYSNYTKKRKATAADISQGGLTGNRMNIGLSALGSPRNFEEYRQKRKEQEEQAARDLAAQMLTEPEKKFQTASARSTTNMLLATEEQHKANEEAKKVREANIAIEEQRQQNIGFKKIGNQVVYVTPYSPLPEPTTEVKPGMIASKAQAPGAYGISVQDYVGAMSAIDAYKTPPKRDAETQAFLDKYFGGNLPTEEEFRSTYRSLIDAGKLTEDEMMSFHVGADLVRRATDNEDEYQQERAKLSQGYNDALALLGVDAEQYATGNPSDYYERYNNTYGVKDAMADEEPLSYRGYGSGEDMTLTDAMKYTNSPYAHQGNDRYDLQRWSMTTQEERDTYAMLKKMHGEEAAESYMQSLEGELNQRLYGWRGQVLQADAHKNWAAATAKSILAAPTQVTGAVYSLGQALKGEEIDPYSPEFATTQMTQVPRAETQQMITENFGKVDNKTGEMKDGLWSWLMKAGYNALTSGADSATSAFFGGGIPGGGAALQGLWSLGGSTQEAILRGGSQGQALLLGGINAMIETATEYLPMENLINAANSKDIKTIKDILWNAVKGAAAEAPGEALSEIGTALSDAYIMRELSNWNQAVKEKGGLQAALELAGNIFTSGFVGALSGAGSTGAASAKSYVQNKAYNRSQNAQEAPQNEPIPELVEAASASVEQEQNSELEEKLLEDFEQDAPVQEYHENKAEEAAEVVRTASVKESKGADEKAENKPENAKNDHALKAAQNAISLGKEGANEPVSVTGIDRVENGKVYVRVTDQNGNERVESTDDMDFAGDMGALMGNENVKRLDARGVQTYVDGYDSTLSSPAEYASDFMVVYERARSGLDYNSAVGNSTFISSEAARAAYLAGMNRYNVDNNVLFGKNLKMQKRVLNALNKVAGGKIRLTDEDMGGANARYNRKTGEILISTKAENGAYAYYAVHELGHKLKAENAEGWSKFQTLVKGAMEKHGIDVDAEIAKVTELYKKHGENLSLEDALEEVVCNNAGSILQDEAVVKDLISKDRKLMESVADFLHEFLEKVNKAMQSLGKDMSELGSWKQMQVLKDDHESLKAIYDSLMDGLESTKNQQSQQNVTGTDVKYSYPPTGKLANNGIERDMPDDERADVLRSMEIQPVPMVKLSPEAQTLVERLKKGGMGRDDIGREIKKLPEYKAIQGSDLHSKTITVPFQFSGKSVNETLKKMMVNGKFDFEQAARFVELLGNLREQVDNAVAIEVHTDRYLDRVYPTTKIENYGALMGIAAKGNAEAPVLYELKNFKGTEKDKLYLVAVFPETKKWATQGISGAGYSADTNPTNVTTYIVADYIPKINPLAGNMLKYFPNELMTPEQIQSAEIARLEQEKYTLANKIGVGNIDLRDGKPVKQSQIDEIDRQIAEIREGTSTTGLREDVDTIEQNIVDGVRPNIMEAPAESNEGEFKYSLSTYNEKMAKPISTSRANALGLDYEVQRLGANGKRTVVASGRDVTEALMRKEGFEQEKVSKVLRYGDRISKWFENAVGKYEFVNLQDVNDASIIIDHNTGEIKFSCQVPNSEYKVNFDFTTVCRQREAVQRFIDDLAKEQGKNGTKLEDISLTPQNIFKLNTILKNEGYETACLGCFVEAKRYRIKQQADTLCEEWNALVLAKNPDAEYFGFSTGDTDLMKMSNDEVTKLEASMRAYSTKGTSKAVDRAARLVELPEMQKLIRASDFISRQGRQKIREFSPALESFLASRFGQGGAKPAVGFMPYNSEIAALPDTKKVGSRRMTLQAYLHNLGGARSNSFSDYIPTHALDYLQRTIDMAARKLTAQCYTKVPGRARTFGMTGEKINMSVMFDIDPNVHWSSAGLDANGEYLVGDKARADKIQSETGERPFTQSFPWDEAVSIEHDPRYAANCGIIGVGYSYKHNSKMMGDDNIPYIIPYHRSSMPESVAKASNTKHATNYEPVQNNTRVTGYAVVTNMDDGDGVPSYATWPEGKKKTKVSSLTWDMQEALKRNGGNAKKTIGEWLDWMQRNDLTPLTSTAEAGHGKFDMYETLEATKDPGATAEDYMEYCLENDMLPVFYEFATMDGYDKYLFDFSVRNLHTGEVALQQKVSFDFMDEVDENEFIAQLDRDMTEYNEYNRDQFYSDKWGRVKEQAYQELQENGNDVKFSLRETDENVQESLTFAEEIFAATHGHRMTIKEAKQMARNVIKTANSTMKVDELANKIMHLYDYVERGENVSQEAFDTMVNALAEEVWATSKMLDEIHEERMQPIRDYFRTTRIALGYQQRREAAGLQGSLGEYRKMVFGRVKLTTDGLPLATAWSELNQLDAELFPADASETEMVQLLLNAVDAMAPVYQNGSGMNAMEAAQWLASEMNCSYFELEGVQNTVEEREKLNLNVKQYREVMERFQKEHKAKFNEAMVKLRADMDEEKAELIRKADEQRRLDKLYAEADANARAREEIEQAKAQTAQEMEAYREALKLKDKEWRKEYRAKVNETGRKQRYRKQITQKVNEIVKLLERPNDKKHVLDGLQEAVLEFCQSIELGGKNQQTRSLKDRINSLTKAFEKAQKDTNSGAGQYIIDPDLMENMSILAEEVKALGSMNDLTADQMRDMRDIVNSVAHTITMADQMFAAEKGAKISDAAVGSMEEMSRKKDKKQREGMMGKVDELLNNGMLDSFRFFDRLGTSGRKMFQALRDGFDVKVRCISEANDYVQKNVQGIDKNTLKGKKSKKTTFKVSGGEIELTKAQVMELYCLSKRETAAKHLYNGGITTDDHVKMVKVTEADVQSIADSLTETERKVADALQQFLEKVCAKWGNETSNRMYGYSKYGEEHYYPMRVDDGSIDTKMTEKGQGENLWALVHPGFSKELSDKANQPLRIGDIFDTFSRHVDSMSNYRAYAAPIADLLRWYNWKPYGEQGIKTMLTQKFGVNGREFIPTLIRDLNGQNRAGYSPGIMETMTKHAKASAVGANIRVVIQQPTAIARAAAMMSPKYIAEGAAMTPKRVKRCGELAKQYCPIAKWKSMGYYETHMGKGLRDLMFGGQGVLNKASDIGMMPAGWADEMTWAALWNACEKETKAMHPELSGEALYQATGKRLGEIIDYTQVVDTPFHRSQLMRSKNSGVQMATAFMSEPTKTYNMLRAAVARWAENRRDPVANRQLGRTLLVFVATGVLNAAAQSVIDAIRDDDDEEELLEKYWDAFGGNVIDNVNPLQIVPYVSDIVSIVQGYEPSRMDMQMVQKVYEIIGEVSNIVNGEGSKWSWHKWNRKVLSAVSYATGVPLENLYRDLTSLYNTAVMQFDGKPLSNIHETATTSFAYENMYDALTKGNQKAWNRIEGKLKGNAESPKSNSDIDTGIGKLLSEDDERIAKAWEAKEAGKASEVDRLRKEIVNELAEPGVLGTTRLNEIVDKAINTYGSKVSPKEEKPFDTEKQLKVRMYTQDDMVKAVRGVADGTVSLTDAKAIMSEVVADSDAKDPEKSVRSNVLGEVKKEYLTAVKGGNTKKATALGNVMQSLLGAKKADMDKWVTDSYAEDLRTAVDSYSASKAKTVMAKLRSRGLDDYDIKDRLQKYRQLYIDAMKRGDRTTANKIKSTLMGLGLTYKDGNPMYTESTFTGWMQ